jgi:hypothetical protein
MNKLQTVLDALEYEACCGPTKLNEAIAIIKQMMQVEPVAIYKGHFLSPVSTTEFLGIAKVKLPTDCKLYTHPALQAVPNNSEPVAWRVWSPDGTNVYQYTEDGDGEPLYAAPKEMK